jgi:CRISPR/Cas system-associated protein Cas10 (large subunit of type III CRISPR-Cas system)
MAGILIYKRLSKEQIEKIYKDTLVSLIDWFEKNPRRRICRIEWIYGQHCKIRKKYIKEDLKKIYQKTILDTFNN